MIGLNGTLSREYISKILILLKQISFHQLYMQQRREQLSRDESFDVVTAFKILDSFRHNKVTPYELYSYFDLAAIESTPQECEQIIKSLNKSITDWTYQDFEETVLPLDPQLKSTAQTRFDNLIVGVGTYAKVVDIREHTKQAIALFLERELHFGRQYLWHRQLFCKQYCGDLLPAFKLFFKTNKHIDYQQFFAIARDYGCIFNKEEYSALVRRSKRVPNQSDDKITKEDFSQLILVNNFNTKEKYEREQNMVVGKYDHKPIPSYKKSHWESERQEKNQQRQKQEEQQLVQKQNKEMNEMKKRFMWKKEKVQETEMKCKWKEWEDVVKGMNAQEIDLQYKKIKELKRHFY